MKQFWKDFKKFISRGNVVDMAVGVAVASAFTAIVTAFTKGFISPLLALFTDYGDLSSLKWVIRPEVKETLADGTEQIAQAEVALLYGTFIQKILDFLIIALVLFLVMRIAAAVAKHTAKVRQNLINALTDEDEKEAERLAKEEAEKAKLEAEKAAAEAEAKRLEEERIAAEAEAKRKELEEEKARLKREEQLLTDIRDLLLKANK